MILSWLHFLPALALLLYPSDRALSSRARLRRFEEVGGQSGTRRFWLWLHPANFLRGLVGSWLLVESISLPTAVQLTSAQRLYPLELTVGVLTLSVIWQMFTRRDSDVLFAPIFFLSGVLCGWLPWEVSVTAVLLGGAMMMGFRSWLVFFPIVALGVAGAGILWHLPKLQVAAAAGLAALPLLLSLTTGRILTVPCRQ